MRRKPPPLSAQEESALAAAQLASALRRGWRPDPLPPAIDLYDEEAIVAEAPVEVWQHVAADVQFEPQTTHFVAQSAGEALAIGFGNSIYNRRQQRKAQQVAVPQWRPIDRGTTWLTTARFACALTTEWADLWHESLRASQLDADGLILWFEGTPPTKLRVAYPEWLFGMFRWIAYGEIHEIPLPAELRARALALGRDVPPELPPAG